ncbi:hypothetical protein vseg_003437 [Gypsophila vaccaria]
MCNTISIASTTSSTMTALDAALIRTRNAAMPPHIRLLRHHSSSHHSRNSCIQNERIKGTTSKESNIERDMAVEFFLQAIQQ